MFNPLRFLAAALGLADSTPTEADAIRMDLMRDDPSGSRNSKRQKRARARARRGKAMKQRQRRLARERGLSRSHP